MSRRPWTEMIGVLQSDADAETKLAALETLWEMIQPLPPVDLDARPARLRRPGGRGGGKMAKKPRLDGLPIEEVRQQLAAAGIDTTVAEHRVLLAVERRRRAAVEAERDALRSLLRRVLTQAGEGSLGRSLHSSIQATLADAPTGGEDAR